MEPRPGTTLADDRTILAWRIAQENPSKDQESAVSQTLQTSAVKSNVPLPSRYACDPSQTLRKVPPALKCGGFPAQLPGVRIPDQRCPVLAALLAASARMFRAAFQSAFAESPQCLHPNSAWLFRLPRSQYPQTEHVFEVLRGSTCTIGIPASVALYERKAASCWNDQPDSLLRASPPRAVTRPRMPSRLSMAMPRPVRLADSTIVLLMQWFWCLRNRASLPDTRTNFFLAPLVPFRWSRFLWTLCLRRIRSTGWPQCPSALSLVVATLAIPMSTPMKSVTGIGVPSGTSMVTIRNHFPSFRSTRSHCPLRWGSRSA